MPAIRYTPVSKALVAANQRGIAELSTADCQVTDVKEVAGFGLIANVMALGEVKLGSAKYCEVEHSQVGESAPQVMQVFMRDAHGLLATFTLTEEIRGDAKKNHLSTSSAWT